MGLHSIGIYRGWWWMGRSGRYNMRKDRMEEWYDRSIEYSDFVCDGRAPMICCNALCNKLQEMCAVNEVIPSH